MSSHGRRASQHLSAAPLEGNARSVIANYIEPKGRVLAERARGCRKAASAQKWAPKRLPARERERGRKVFSIEVWQTETSQSAIRQPFSSNAAAAPLPLPLPLPHWSSPAAKSSVRAVFEQCQPVEWSSVCHFATFRAPSNWKLPIVSPAVQQLSSAASRPAHQKSPPSVSLLCASKEQVSE